MCKMYAKCITFTSARAQLQRTTRARELVDAYPTVHVPGVACDTPSAWLEHRTHIRAARTEIYAIGCEVYIVAFIDGRPFHACGSNERAPLVRPDTISRSIMRRTANEIGDLSRPLIAAFSTNTVFLLSMKATKHDI